MNNDLKILSITYNSQCGSRVYENDALILIFTVAIEKGCRSSESPFWIEKSSLNSSLLHFNVSTASYYSSTLRNDSQKTLSFISRIFFNLYLKQNLINLFSSTDNRLDNFKINPPSKNWAIDTKIIELYNYELSLVGDLFTNMLR